jgi:hypothetical protein
MKLLTIKAVPITASILYSLEKSGLIRTLKATPNVLQCRSPKGTVGTIYRSGKKSGTHKLISIRCTTEKGKLNFHTDNEEFLLVNSNAKKFSSLYMVVCLHKNEVLAGKINNKQLCENDFIALRLKYNDPCVSIFSMLKGTAHFELAAKNRKQAPVFFVSEPSELKMHLVKMPGYEIALKI